MRTKQRLAAVQMLVCATLWSIGGIFIKLLDWNPFVIAGTRSLLAAAVIGIYMLAMRQKLIFSKKAFISASFLCATFLCFVSANKLTTAANAIVLQYTAPIFIVLFSAIFFRQRFRASDIITVGATFGGIVLFFLSSVRSGGLGGDCVAVLAGASFGGMYVSVGQIGPEEKMSGLFFGQLLTAAIGIPFCLFTKNTVTAASVFYIVILGVVQIGIPYILMALATNHCPPLACSLIGAVEPILNPIWVLIFTGEKPGLLSLIGGVIVIAAVTVQCVLQDNRAEGAQPACARI